MAQVENKNKGGMIVLFLFILVCSCLGIAAFVMSFTKCKKDGFAIDSKNRNCHVNYEPCKKVPEPLVAENKECLKNFWEKGKYKHIVNFFPGASSKYPNGYIERGIYNITHKDKYRIHMSLTSHRYIKNEKIPFNFDKNYIRNYKGHIIVNDVNSLGTNSNGYLTKCSPTEIEELLETESEAFGKNMWFKGITKKTDYGYKCIWMQTSDLNKPWTLAYEKELIRIDDEKNRNCHVNYEPCNNIR
jgi:Na+-transporting methylmalonyl-CoA/oxaloacetate decarboxylase gamma subunit